MICNFHNFDDFKDIIMVGVSFSAYPHAPQAPLMPGTHRALVVTRLTLTSALIAATLQVTPTAHAGVAQEFFVPMPEDRLANSFRGFYPQAGNTIDSAISISTMQPGTVVYYDHWEDGYETNLESPAQSTTEIWGDNNPANGIPPGFSTDLLTAASVVKLRNLIDTPRLASTVTFDGRDKIGVTKPVALTRMTWSTDPGPVLAGAVQIQSTLEYGTQHICPIGENTPNTSYNEVFERVELCIMAAENGTQLQIDKDANGSFETTTTLNAGEGFAVAGIFVGAVINSSKPVQAHLITGDVGATYESRWFNLFPRDTWGSEYFNPVSSASLDTPANVFLFNPNNNAITVQVSTTAGTTSIPIPARSTNYYEMPLNSGARFFTTGAVPPVFTGMVAMDSDQPSGSGNTSFEWGFTLVPKSSLTAAIKVGYGPGTSDVPPTANGSPAWVIAANATRLYIDYDGDLSTGPLTDPNGNRYDYHTDVAALQSTLVYDNNDNDQSGLRVYAADGTKITAAWGQDANIALGGNPFLDLGYTVLPHPLFFAVKTGAIVQDLNLDGVADRDDIIEYTIAVTNIGIIPVNGVTIKDVLEGNVTYNPGSTTLGSTPVADNIVPPASTVFPIDEAGLSLGNLGVSQTKTVRFRVTVGYQGPGSIEIRNTVIVSIVEQDTPDETGEITPTRPTPCPNITLSSSRPSTSVALTNQAYSATFSNNGRDGPYTYQIASGSLPPGLNITNAGVVSGTPTTPGTYSFTLTARDIYTCSAQGTFTIVVADPLALCPSVSALPRALQNTPYSVTITPAGGTGPYLFEITSGNLQNGLSLNPSTGQITGTPTVAQTRSFVIRVTDSLGTPTSVPYELEVASSASLILASKGNYNVPITSAQILRAGTTPITQTTSAPGVTLVTTNTLELTQLNILDQGVPKTLAVVNHGGGTVHNVNVSSSSTDYGVVNAGDRQTIASLGLEPFKLLAASTSSNANLNNYIDDARSDTLPDGNSEYDMMFDLPYDIDDIVIMSERFGNSTARLTPLDAAGNVITNSNSIQLGPPYDWNTGFASPYNSGQPYWLIAVRAGTFGVNQPIHGFRVDTHGADIKFFGMSESAFADTPGTPASIGDRVWADTNQNGLQDAGEPGVAGFTVELRSLSDNALVKTVSTGTDGRYQFTNVGPGDYRIRFVPNPLYTFTTRAAGSNRSLDSDADTSTGFTSSFSMLTCETRSDMDAGLRFLADYGDLASLPTRGSLTNANLRMGTLVDGETSPQLNALATGDDTNNLNDEDGVTLPSSVVLSGSNTLTVNTTNTTTSTAYLSAWIDFNQNGSLTDPGEQVATDLPILAGTALQNQPVTFSAPPIAFAGQAAVRVSLNSLPGTLSTGVAGSGETEDYLVPLVCPTITLSPSTFPTTREALPFQMPFVAQGGTAPYLFDMISGALPTWAQLNPGTGVFSGTPDSTTTASFTLRVTDVHGCSATQAYTITPLPRPTLGVGNLIFFDLNDNGTYDPGEGLPNVPVQLFSNTQTPSIDSPLATTTSAPNGSYLFSGLQPGLYRLHIPASAFQTGGPLLGMSSIAEGFSGDDDFGQDGRSSDSPELDGVSSGLVSLFLGTTPTADTGETGFLASDDDDLDAAVDLTIDFGFQLPLTLGNRLFIDANRNGRYDPSEGTPGVTVELFLASQDPQTDLPILSQTTTSDGSYLFTQLTPTSYRLHVPASEFQSGAPLHQLESLPGTTPSGDDDLGEDGLDDPLPQRNGISTAPIPLSRNSLPTNATFETGSDYTLDDNNDPNGDLTLDLGFRSLDPLLVGVGNLVFFDTNSNGHADPSEGVPGVTVQLFPDGANPQSDTPLASTTTNALGSYLFRNLPEGEYFIHIPASQFQSGAPLFGMRSLPGAGNDSGLDDDFDEDGLDSPEPHLTGISSSDFSLSPDTEPLDAWGEWGHDFDLDDADDDNTDLTIDLGFTTPVAVGNLVFLDANANGRADPAEGVPGVTVQLFPAFAQPQFDTPIATTTTDSEGRYLFTDLAPGQYFLHIPSWMFASSAPLHTLISLPGNRSGDDDTGEDGLDNPQAPSFGISTPTFTLATGSLPAGSAEPGFDAASDDSADTNTDLTRDFGFSLPATLGATLFHDLNADGTHQPLGTDNTPGTPDDELTLPGITVEVWFTGDDQLIGTTDDTFIDLLETTLDGTCQITTLAAGTYHLRIPDTAFTPGNPLADLPVATPIRVPLDNQTPGDSNATQPAGRATAALSPPIALTPGETDTTIGFGFLATLHPITWPAWQARNTALPDTTPSGDPDGDSLPNLLEFAFGLDSKTGISPHPPLRIEVDPATQRIDLCLDRVASLSGLTLTLELLPNLANSPAGWSDNTTLTPIVTPRPDDTEELRFQNIAAHPAFTDSPSQGFARLRLALDADLNGTPEATLRTHTLGWTRLTLGTHLQTLAHSFTSPARFSATVESLSGTSLNLPSALNGASPTSLFTPGAQHYLEVLTGTHAGHRLELNETASTTTFVLDPTSARHTLPGDPPATLTGAQIALRQHLTLADLADRTRFTATNSPATADRVLIYNTAASTFQTYWLFAFGGNPRWVRQDDSTFANQAALVIEPGRGLFIHSRTQSVSLVLTGQVRDHPFASPLLQGVNLYASGWPMPLSPNALQMTAANGFTANLSSSLADQIQRWQADTQPTAQGYQGLFYLGSGTFRQWTTIGDNTFTNQSNTPILQPHRALLIRTRTPHPTWTPPSPWTP